jgi:hypothetical protein
MTATLKYLRIAVTALSLTAFVLLIALWVRSYWWIDSLQFPITSTHCVGCWSVEGTVAVYRGIYPPGYFSSSSSPFLSHGVVNRQPWDRPQAQDGYHWPLGFGVMQSGMSRVPYAPHWFYALLVGMIAPLPWVHCAKRFSLRTPLIAMALVALALGIIVVLR